MTLITAHVLVFRNSVLIDLSGTPVPQQDLRVKLTGPSGSFRESAGFPTGVQIRDSGNRAETANFAEKIDTRSQILDAWSTFRPCVSI